MKKCLLYHLLLAFLCGLQNADQTPETLKKPIGTLGHHVDPTKMIIGGVPADISEHRHQVSIRKKSEDKPFGEGFFCGGSLVTPTCVITAAHCIWWPEDASASRSGDTLVPISDIKVVMGTESRLKKTKNTQIFDAENYTLHPDFKHKPDLEVGHDIAVIKLKGKAKFNPHVHSIPLTDKDPELGAKCTITGWGVTNVGGSKDLKFSDILLKANMQVIPREKCEDGLGVPKTTICAAEPNHSQDSCLGDSGGPLVCDGRLAGVISVGLDCTILEKGPGMYVSIASHRDWLSSVLSG